MNEKVRRVLHVLGKSGRLLGALPLIVLGAGLGIALYWGLAPARPATTTAPAAGGNGQQQAESITWWTCSMHPEIHLPRPGLCPKCGMELIPEKAGAQDGMAGMRVFTTSENAKALMNIATATVERRFPTVEIRMVGKVDYDETRLSYITAWVPGRLDRLFVDYTGAVVKKGDQMVYLYSPELYSTQEELLQALKAVRDLQRSNVEIVRDTAQATVDAARGKLRLLGLSEEQVAQVERRGKAEDHVIIYAPVGGIVIHRNAQEGMYVQTGTRIYTLADLSQVWVKLDAYESDLIWIRYGQKVEFTSVSYPGKTLTGTISFIDPVLNPLTRTVKVRVNVPNADGMLKPEMFVNGVVHSKMAAGGRVVDESLAGKWICPMHPEIVKDVPGKCDICGMPLVKAETLGYLTAATMETDKPLVIPVSAALVTGTRAIVYVEGPDPAKPTYEGREIVLGPRAGNYYIVRRGLSEGEHVVTRGNFKIDSALQIQAKPSMMTPDGGGGSSVHHHGPATMKAGESQPAAGAELPAMFVQQLQQVLAAAGEAQDTAQGEDLPAVRAAFGELDQALKEVNPELVQGHPHMLWMELSMRLGNDAFEGKEARTITEARWLAKSLEGNASALRGWFGLGQAEQAASSAGEAVPAAFGKQLGAVFAGYFAMGKALAGDDAAKATAGLKQVADALDKVDMSPLAGEAHEAWMKHRIALSKILAPADEAKDLKRQRELFAPLSEEAASLARRFPPDRQDAYYLLRCPMAFEGRGAVWLQQSQQTQNPYFGAAMLTCGDVQEMICGQAATGSAPAARAAEQKHD
ncbi:MAG TPA: efflux RND transporter periplasmic adaptor subunit [Phycisphaerae bacterium]|nr:efflux RND transporter periplasmic adaptor subunit [Phycisphaerae bacterium]